MNERFQNALAMRAQNIPPIWFMRQAGRYQSKYQTLRQQHSFVEMCKNANLAAQVALNAIDDFDFDVAILFSDLLFPLEAMGMGLRYEPAPVLAWQLDASNLKNLRSVGEAMPALEFQGAAMRATRAILPNNKSLIGFVGGPWTLFTYACEGAHKGGLEATKSKFALFTPFCARVVPLLKQNIQLQLENGAEVVMLFDTAAGELAPIEYKELIPDVLADLANCFPKKLGYYAKGISPAHLQHKLFNADSPLAGLGLDHRWDLPDQLKKNKLGFMQGNFDQALLFSTPDEFKQRAEKYLLSFKALKENERSGWVCGLGHGVLPGTPVENVRHFVKLAREVFA